MRIEILKRVEKLNIKTISVFGDDYYTVMQLNSTVKINQDEYKYLNFSTDDNIVLRTHSNNLGKIRRIKDSNMLVIYCNNGTEIQIRLEVL